MKVRHVVRSSHPENLMKRSYEIMQTIQKRFFSLKTEAGKSIEQSKEVVSNRHS